MDLEQYGVWVKAGPEDVTDDTEEMFALSDVADDVDESSFEEERSLTSEEEDLLASLEDEENDLPDFSDTVSGEDAGFAEATNSDSQDFSFSLDDSDDELDETLSINDFSLDDIESEFSEESISADEAAPSAAQSSADDDQEFSIDLDDDEFSIETLESAETGTTSSRTGFAAPDEELDIDLESIPADEEHRVDEMDDIDALMDSDEELPELEIDDDLELELDQTVFKASFDEIAEKEATHEEDFDDIGAVTAQMMGSGSPGNEEPLSGIETELASIKSELQALKAELAELRKSGANPSIAAVVSKPIDVDDPEIDTGFFEEDEDETIALTGDELDNILNTAEFTEELGKPSEVDEIETALAEEATEEDASEEELIFDDIYTEQPESSDSENGLSPGPRDEEITFEAEPEDDLSTDLLLDEADENEVSADSPTDPFVGSQDEVDALAELDIESELEGIEELPDDDRRPMDLDTDSLGGFELEEETDSSTEPAATETPPDTLQDDVILDLGDTADDELELSLDDIDEDETLLSLDDDDDELGIDLDSDEGDVTFLLDNDQVLTPSYQSAPTHEDAEGEELPSDLRDEIRSVLRYMDQLLESLPEEKIEEFARSEHFDVYKRLFEELGLES